MNENTQAAHPLFPASGPEEDPPDVVTIHVMRIPDGTHIRPFDAAELTSLEQVYEMWGGGNYTLIARDQSYITGKVTVRLPGESLPLNPVRQPDARSAEQHDLDARPGAPATSDSMMVTMMLAVMKMMSDQSAQQTQLVVSMLGQGQQGANSHVATMQTLHDRHSQAQTQLMQAMLASQSNKGSGDVDALLRGLELGKEMVVGERDDADELGQLLETVAPLAEGFIAAQNPAVVESE